jgi:AraC family transcriptional regulator of adaptative response/methylated-DNA-[protein]-cysteine methyltransferase
MIDRDPEFVGTFFVGVRSTGVFCHAICPARKPAFEQCEFFKKPEEALLAGYRPCKRCLPLSHPSIMPDAVRKLVEMVEADPIRRWRESDFSSLGLSAKTASRQFQKRFGMTFVQYARARRMGMAMQEIRNGSRVIDAQWQAGYSSASGFRDGFSQIFGTPPVNAGELHDLSSKWLETPLGSMLAIADEDALLLLEFSDRRGLEREIEELRCQEKAVILPRENQILNQAENQINAYFNGDLKKFNLKTRAPGSPFQQTVWLSLQDIPFGETCSYTQLATRLGKPNAARAVGNANGKNRIAIIIPCHRVIRSNGDLGGYGGKKERKQWLLEHEGNLQRKQEN